MKVLKICLFVYMFISFINVKGQESVKIFNKKNRPQTVIEQKNNNSYHEAIAMRKVEGRVKSNSAIETTPNNYAVDERALKYYTPEDISKMSVKEKKEVNYLLQSSFEIVKVQGAGCPLLDKSKINVIDYSFYRSENDKSEIIIDEKCNYRLILSSVNDIFNANSLITE